MIDRTGSGRSSGSARTIIARFLPLLAAAGLTFIGILMRWPNMIYDGPPTSDAYVGYALDRFAYSDVAMLYFRDGLAAQPLPYLDYPFEYPVGIGLVVYLASLAAPTFPSYFLLTSLFLATCGIATAALVDRFRAATCGCSCCRPR
jgi:hypothetical protein